MLDLMDISGILARFGLSFQKLSRVCDTTRSGHDVRLNYILDERYVLKVNSASVLQEERLQEISRLIARYRSIGVYCPEMLPTLAGPLSCRCEKNGKAYTCYVEEYAVYPPFEWDAAYDRREVVEHLGVLAARYTGVDLLPAKSMWSIIDLAPLDVDMDEKQENANTLVTTLHETREPALAHQTDRLNVMLRERIQTVFDDLPRCVFQGDLNPSNILHDRGHFAGLIDFNLSGTDVNINVFLNETNWFPEEDLFDRMSVPEMIQRMNAVQEGQLSVIFRHYTMNGAERFAFPYYQRIVNLFQYPNVCAMVKWLREDARHGKCTELIRALTDQPL